MTKEGRRPEVVRLLEQARADLRTAEDMLNAHFDACSFYSQQSVEKALKALYMHVRKKTAPHTHDLTEIASELNAPNSLGTPLAKLTSEYTKSRYPDAANGVPARLYTRAMAGEALTLAREVWKWVERQF